MIMVGYEQPVITKSWPNVRENGKRERGFWRRNWNNACVEGLRASNTVCSSERLIANADRILIAYFTCLLMWMISHFLLQCFKDLVKINNVLF